ncbi:hypothetical protein HXX76_003037 [Chlamydomonas incerta]|uniref:Transmembrane protein 186 n=1 Tax=Chlamydomonas incerta TaxID=51695 RepID=A0A835W9C6_CHLIN|nr:hypothetical protein HXX76_003037 [Chlamydomonas incerta]|eukprot:KAG2442963.1 hypothetical protein HXX76_003037 [Chlamydomonas incerta]
MSSSGASGSSSSSSSRNAAGASGSSSGSNGGGGGPDVGAAGAGKGAAADASANLLGGLRLQVPSNPFAPRPPRPAAPKLVLYRGPGMLFFRFVVRAKVFQLMGFLAAAVFASVVLTSNNPNPMDLAAVGALAVGCVVTSYCIWYYSGRYVGEMSLLLPERRVVRFSVLDFWGNREDNDVPLERVVPPWHQRSVAEVRGQARQALMPVAVRGDREYYISVPHGHVLQKELLQKLLYGAPLEGEAAASGGDGAASSTGSSVEGGSGSSSAGGDSAGAPAGGQGAQAPAGEAAADGAGALSEAGKAAGTDAAAVKGRAA